MRNFINTKGGNRIDSDHYITSVLKVDTMYMQFGSKGQLISKCPFGSSILSKNEKKNLLTVLKVRQN